MNGSIQHRPERPKPWRARYRGPDGREVSRSFPTKAAAARWLRGELASVDRGEWVDTSRTVTVSEWFPSWLASKRRITERTRDDYREIYESRIEPTFGNVPLPRVTRDRVAEWVEGMVRDGLSPSRIRKVHVVLSAMLDGAADERLIGRNPAKRIELPRVESSEHQFLTGDEVERLASAMVDRDRAMVYVLAYGGLRFGEAQALRVTDVDPLRNRVHVRRRVMMVRDDDGKRRPRIKALTKNHTRRTVQLPAFVTEHVARHLSEHVPQGDAEALVFTSPQGHLLNHSNYRRQVWNPATVEAGLDGLNVHSLRHSCASLMRAMGATVEAVSQQLGHRSPIVTLSVYSHLFEGALDDVMGRLDEAHRDLTRPTRGPTVTDIADGRA